jgi:hypothetical protein
MDASRSVKMNGTIEYKFTCRQQPTATKNPLAATSSACCVVNFCRFLPNLSPLPANVKFFTNFSCDPNVNLITIRRDAVSRLDRVFFN